MVSNLDKKMRMEVDVSDYTIGGVLSIEYNRIIEVSNISLKISQWDKDVTTSSLAQVAT